MQEIIEKALKKGVAMQEAGDLNLASQFFETVISLQPHNPDANHNLGMLAVSVGKVQEAVPFLKTALEADPNRVQFWLSYIDVLIKLDCCEDAKALLDKARSKGAKGPGFDELKNRLQKAGKSPREANQLLAEPKTQQPNILDSLKLDQAIKLAKKKANAGFPEEAKGIYRDILTRFPKNKRASEGLSRLVVGPIRKSSNVQEPPHEEQQTLINLFSAGQLHQALQETRGLIEKYPRSAFLFNIQGAILKELGHLEQSIEAYKQALAIKPDYAEACNNMGNALQRYGKLEEAKEAYSKALAIKPDNAEAYYNLGNVLKVQDQLEEAVAAYNKAVVIMPHQAEIYNNMGNALKDLGRLEEAVEVFNKALDIKPDYADAYHNLGNPLFELGNLEEAIEAYNKALAIKPDNAGAYNSLSFAKLQSDCWREGVELRKWRWQTQNQQVYKRSFSVNEWDGKESIHDKTLLVWDEQGPGDMVIWASCIDHYTKICGKIIIECPPKLVELFKRSLPNVLIRPSVNGSKDSLDDFDLHVPMETLFGYACLSGLCTEIQASYIFPDPERTNYWSAKLKKISKLKTVGLSWKSPVMTTQRSKNYPPLSYWGEALQGRNLTLINLQSTDYQSDINYLNDNFGCNIIHMSELDLFNDLADVAALSQALDCTISVATAAATISAAVGTRTIIPTWSQSSWNNILFSSRGPNVDIIQKDTCENWDGVFAKIKTQLDALA